jgi:chromosome segregation ATPase
MTHEELVVEHVRLSRLVVAKKNEISSIQSKLDLSEMDVGALKGEMNRRNEELREANKWKMFWEKSSESHGRDIVALKKQVERLESDNKFKERCIKDLKHQLDDNTRSDQAFRRILHSQIDAEKEKVKRAEALIKSMQEEPNSHSAQLDLLTSQIAELRLENELLRATRAERGFLKSLMPHDGQVAHASD